MKIAGIRPSGWSEDGTTPQPLLIEMTAKRWKGLLLLSFVSGIFGLILVSWQIWADVYQPLLADGFNLSTSPIASFGDIFAGVPGALGLVLVMTSIALGAYARFMAWWHHG